MKMDLIKFIYLSFICLLSNNILLKSQVEFKNINSSPQLFKELDIDHFTKVTIETNNFKSSYKYKSDKKIFNKDNEENNWVISTGIVYSLTGNTEKYTYEYDSEFRLSNVKYEIGNNGIWMNEGNTDYEYDISGNLITLLYYIWQNGTWVNDFKWTIVYDNVGNQLTSLFEEWKNSVWVNVRKSTFTYDSNSNMLSNMEEVWQNGLWIYSGRTTYTVDLNGNTILQTDEEWQNNSWVYKQKLSTTYDAHDNKLTELWKLWQNNKWVNFGRITNNYDANSNLLVRLSEYWANGGWNYSFRETNTYDLNKNILSSLLEQWQNSNWTNYARLTYTYDSNNLTLKLVEQWQNNSWINFEKKGLWYDENGNTVYSENSKWQNGNWIPSESFIDITYNKGDDIKQYYGSSVQVSYIQNKIVGVPNSEKIIPTSYQLYQNYPNPFNPSTNIKYHISKIKSSENLLNNVTLIVYDVLGNKVATLVNEEQQAGSYIINFNASSLSSGIYYYMLNVGEFNKVRKMIVIK